MAFAFPWPFSTGEWLAFTCALITIGFGLLLLLAPRLSLRILGLQSVPDRPDSIAEARGTLAGFYLGLGLACLLLAQPMLYLALAAGWVFTALGRLVSILADRAGTRWNWYGLAIEAALAALAGAFPLGFIA